MLTLRKSIAHTQMVVILDIKLREELDKQMYPKKAKKCTKCGKVLRSNNKSMLCSYHNQLYLTNKKKAEKWIKQMKKHTE